MTLAWLIKISMLHQRVSAGLGRLVTELF